MKKELLIQHDIFTIPQTTGEQIYSHLFKSDENYNYLTGVMCTLIGSMPTADYVMVEIKDDFQTILSFSPLQNWAKDTTSQNWDLYATFRPLSQISKGKNFYMNVKVKNSTAFKFAAYYRQELKEPTLYKYDMQTFGFDSMQLGVNYSITLPNNYNVCKGVFVTGGDTANAALIALDINDNTELLLDPVTVNALTITQHTKYEQSFFPLNFESANKNINVRLTPIVNGVQYTPATYFFTFLIVKNSNNTETQQQ